LNSTATQSVQDETATDDQSREAADRVADERAEDNGMIVHQGVITNVQSSKDPDAFTAR